MGDLLTTIFSVICALGVVIFLHELGHLLVAKLFDTRVNVFSLGFGKRLFGFQRGETDYRVSLIPLGGYVALGGENPEEATGDPREFVSKARWQRILIYLAGPTMNVVLSILLIAGAFMIGIRLPNLSAIEPVVGEVEAGSSAEGAGLRVGDRILSVNGEPADNWEEVVFALHTSPEKPVTLEVRRGERTFSAQVTPGKLPKYEAGDTAGLFPEMLPEIIGVEPGRPAAEAGFVAGDRLRSVDGQPVAGVMDFIRLLEQHPGEEIRVEVIRGAETLLIPVVPEDQGGVGKIGAHIGLANVFQKYGPAQAIVESARRNVAIVRQTFALLGKILTRQLSAKGSLGGPIEIAVQSGEAAKRGFADFVYFMGFISISIAILNLMPIPMLDGGQIVILGIESVIRRDLPLRIKEVVTQVGFVLIMLLMLTVIWFDLSRNLASGSGEEPASRSAEEQTADEEGAPEEASGEEEAQEPGGGALLPQP